MTSAAIQPKPWKCERCGHTKGLVESDGVIQCFTIPACVERQVARATDARAAKPNVYGWMLARHATRTILKVPRLRVRVTIQLWRPWRDDA